MNVIAHMAEHPLYAAPQPAEPVKAPSDLRNAVCDLVSTWRKQQSEYPDEGKLAAAAVRLCANELEDLLARHSSGQPADQMFRDLEARVQSLDVECAQLEAENDRLKNAQPATSAMTRYKEAGGHDEPNPLERLRFFCSLAMSEQDWLDSESLFDDLSKTKDFDFAIEDRAAGRTLVWRNGSCRPASAEECVMWDALVNQMSGSRKL